MNYYSDAQIYLIKCTHPDFSHLRYVGLDTKCDPNYLGSSTTGKWWINYLGRRYFSKTILETVSGSMRQLCEVEQKYILRHNAVKSPDYFNMNGGKLSATGKDLMITMDETITTQSPFVKDFIRQIIGETEIPFLTGDKRMLVSQIVCMLVYGKTQYDQEVFEYNERAHYCHCSPESLEQVLHALAREEFIDFDSNEITILERFIDDIPYQVNNQDFEITI